MSNSTTRYEGWKKFAEAPFRIKPETLTTDRLEGLSSQERRIYNRSRAEWHANILLRTRQVEELELQLDELIESNLQDAGRVKNTAVIDAAPDLGKSTLIQYYGRRFHREQLEDIGEYLDNGDTLHLPVCHVRLPGKVTIKGLHEQLLTFYAHPSTAGDVRSTMRGRDLAAAAADCVDRHGTRLVIIDDLHFLNPRTRDGVEVANQLKWLANEYDATFLLAGVSLHERGLITEGQIGSHAALAQTGRRWTVFGMERFTMRTKAGRDEWDRFLANIEHKLVLGNAAPGMLLELNEYLFARSSGTIGSFMDLIRKGAYRAIVTGRERLDRDLLEGVKLDVAAEAERSHWENELSKKKRSRSAASRSTVPQLAQASA